MTDFRQILATLANGEVEFILVGGVAATVHGSSQLTVDVDIVYRRTRENITRLAAALAPLSPYLRGAPTGLPFRFDAGTIERGLNFTLDTSLGQLDVLGEATGGGTYDALLPHSQEIQVFGIKCLVVSLDQLIYLKRAAGRRKDLDAIAELELLRDQQGQSPKKED